MAYAPMKKPAPECPPPADEDRLTPAQEKRYYDIGMKAVVAQHEEIAAFIKSRHFNDDGLIRGLIVEYIRFSAIYRTKKSDNEL
jgi:hypothetical protein